jgi:uncharacterized secreted repeat protein (TIGR03808 family)
MSDVAKTSALSRRSLLRLCAGAVLTAPCAAQAQDQTESIAGRLRDAARRGGVVRLPRGTTAIRSLELPPGATLVGERGSTLKLIGQGPLLYARGAAGLTLENLTFDGAEGLIAKDGGLLDFEDVASLRVHGCAIENSKAHGIKLTRCGGVFTQNRIERARDAAYFSLDGFGVDIDNNHIRDCGDNGVLVWTSKEGAYEGSRVRNNLIEDIHNFSGGDGLYGNGVGVYRCGSVRVENNRIHRCAYTAVRNTGAHDVAVLGNDCKDFGEKAMYAEFGAKRAVFRDNRIENAGGGIAVTNGRSHGTDGGGVAGNTILSLRETHPDSEFGPEMFWRTGVLGERNCEIAGNKIIGPAWIGVALGGWRENVRAVDNVIEGADFGVVFATGPDVGEGTIARNRILSARKAAVIAFAGAAPVGGDLLARSARAEAFPRLTVSDNSTE